MDKHNVYKNYIRLTVGVLLWALPITEGFATAITGASRGLVDEKFGRLPPVMYNILSWFGDNHPYILFTICAILALISLVMIFWGSIGIIKEGISKIRPKGNKEEAKIECSVRLEETDEYKRMHKKIEELYEENIRLLKMQISKSKKDEDNEHEINNQKPTKSE